jgi:uncharacterized protein YggE
MKALLASFALLAFAGLASANVTTSGTGKVIYVPDLGYIHAGVSTDGKTATEAWAKNADTVKKIFDALKQMGLDDKDLKTGHIGLTPRYVYRQNEEPLLVGYTASYDLTVSVRKLPEMGAILDTMVDNGANRNVGISFSSTELDKLMDDARTKAATEARKNANLYVTAAGAQLGPVLTISDASYAQPQVYRFEMDAKAASHAPLQIAAGQQELSVTVTITFAINQKVS